MSLWVHRVFSCQAPCQASFRHLPWASSPMMDVALRTRFCPRRAHCWCQSPWSFAFGRFVLNFPLTHSMWWLSNFRSRGARGSWGGRFGICSYWSSIWWILSFATVSAKHSTWMHLASLAESLACHLLCVGFWVFDNNAFQRVSSRPGCLQERISPIRVSDNCFWQECVALCYCKVLLDCSTKKNSQERLANMSCESVL